MAKELPNAVCLSWVMSVIVVLHSFSSRSRRTGCSSSGGSFPAACVTPWTDWIQVKYRKFWPSTSLTNCLYCDTKILESLQKYWLHLCLSYRERKAGGQKTKKSYGLVQPWAVSSNLVTANFARLFPLYSVALGSLEIWVTLLKKTGRQATWVTYSQCLHETLLPLSDKHQNSPSLNCWPQLKGAFTSI